MNLFENNFKIPSKTETVEESKCFPRSAWKSQLAYLKAALKAKQALEKEEALGVAARE